MTKNFYFRQKNISLPLSGDFWAAQPTAKVGGDPTPWFEGLGGALGIYQLGLKVSLFFFGRLGRHSQPNVYLDRN